MDKTTNTNIPVAAPGPADAFIKNIHVPFPQELAVECEKAKNIIDEFSKTMTGEAEHAPVPAEAFIHAKGIVIISVIKIGAGWSGRVGSGLILAKLPSGQWSAPSAVALIGAGYGPQIGASITDFVYVLNSYEAINSFAQNGQLTIGAQFSMTAGDNSKGMEASALIASKSSMVTLPGYCYAKSKGLFIGVSLEGSVIATRKKTNARYYRESTTQAQLLSSTLEPAAAAEQLYRSLAETQRLALAKVQRDATNALATVSRYAESVPAYSAPAAAPTPYTTPFVAAGSSEKAQEAGLYPSLPTRTEENQLLPQFEPIAIALYDFEAERPTDLSFKKGDVIAIVSRSDTTNDWWVGRLNGKEGRFPANRTKVEPQ